MRRCYKPKCVTKRSKHTFSAAMTLCVSLLLLVSCVVGGVLAYLFTQTDSITNTFTPAKTSVKVEESFDGAMKSGVTVKNTGDIPVYVRIKLVTYRVNDVEQHIGGAAEIPTFTPGIGWVENGGFYYYTSPIAAGGSPASPLIGSPGITLQKYTDADGGKQVIEVMAEAIQALGVDASGKKAVVLAWGLDPETLR